MGLPGKEWAGDGEPQPFIYKSAQHHMVLGAVDLYTTDKAVQRYKKIRLHSSVKIFPYIPFVIRLFT